MHNLSLSYHIISVVYSIRYLAEYSSSKILDSHSTSWGYCSSYWWESFVTVRPWTTLNDSRPPPLCPSVCPSVCPCVCIRVSRWSRGTGRHVELRIFPVARRDCTTCKTLSLFSRDLYVCLSLCFSVSFFLCMNAISRRNLTAEFSSCTSTRISYSCLTWP